MDTQTSEQSVIEGVKKQLYINGEWRDAAGGGTPPVEDPSTGETLCEVADAQPEDALAALDAASKAQAEPGASALSAWAASASAPAPASPPGRWARGAAA